MCSDPSLTLAGIAGGIVADLLGDSVTCDVSRTADGNTIQLAFSNLPLWPDGHPGPCFVCFPASTFCIRGGNVCFLPIQQSQCRYYQGRPGIPLAHPHVYGDGHPCWDGSSRERAVDFLCNMAETLTLQNVSRDSVEIGHCATDLMGFGDTALANARRQQLAVRQALHYRPVVCDHRKLESYINRRWCSKLTLLMDQKEATP